MPKQINTAWLKNPFILLLLFCITTRAFGQSPPAVVYRQYKLAKTEADKNNAIDAYIETFRNHDLAPALRDLIKMHDYLKKEGDKSGIGTGRIGLVLAKVFEKTGDYRNSLLYSLPALHNFEQLNDTAKIIDALMEIGEAFTRSENIPQGIYYYSQCKSVIEAYHNKSKYPLVLNNLADCYNEINAGDSALTLINTALALAEKSRDSGYSCRIYATMGKTQLARGDDKLARVYLNKGLQFANNISDWSVIANIYCGLAKSYFNTGDYSLVLQNAYKAAWYAEPNFKKEQMQAFEWLYKAYEKAGNQRDSVYKYFRMAATIKDSLFTVQKTRSQQEIYLQEQLRNEEIQTARIREAAERKQTITYILIGIGIIIFIGLFLLLSQSFITNEKFIRVLGIIALLIVFEFFNLLLHPFLEKVTGHSTILMLFALAGIAALLAPLHHKTEKWAITKLVEKNKRIRLTRAKRTITLLEKENGEDVGKE
jgi:tetratricopeptide (TPR) repeat protein